MKHLKKFNELNSSTYKRAANKAYDYGRDTLGDDLITHGEEVENREAEEASQKMRTGIKPEFKDFTLTAFSSSESSVEISLVSFNIGQNTDVWNDTVDMNDIDLETSLQFINTDNNPMELYINVTGEISIYDEHGEMVADSVKFDRKGGVKFKKILRMYFSEMGENSTNIKEYDAYKSEADKLMNLSIHKFLN